MFWIGVVLIAIVIGIFSALLGNVPSKQSPRRIVMGAGKVNNTITPKQVMGKASTKTKKTRSPSKTNPLKAEEEFSFAPPGTIKISPSRAKGTTRNSQSPIRNRSSSPGIVELKVNRKEPQLSPRPQRKAKNNTRRFNNPRDNETKRVKKTNSSRASKPLSQSQYRLLKLQVENLLRNQRVREAKRRLTLAKKRLKPSDQFYLEINMLLDSISQ